MGGGHFTKEKGHNIFLGQIFPLTPGPKVRLGVGAFKRGGGNFFSAEYILVKRNNIVLEKIIYRIKRVCEPRH